MNSMSGYEEQIRDLFFWRGKHKSGKFGALKSLSSEQAVAKLANLPLSEGQKNNEDSNKH